MTKIVPQPPTGKRPRVKVKRRRKNTKPIERITHGEQYATLKTIPSVKALVEAYLLQHSMTTNKLSHVVMFGGDPHKIVTRPYVKAAYDQHQLRNTAGRSMVVNALSKHLGMSVEDQVIITTKALDNLITELRQRADQEAEEHSALLNTMIAELRDGLSLLDEFDWKEGTRQVVADVIRTVA